MVLPGPLTALTSPAREGGRARRPALTLALPCAGLGRGAQRAGGQTLPLVQEKPPLALDAEVLAEAALTRGPAFCKRAGITPGERSCPEGGPLCLPEVERPSSSLSSAAPGSGFSLL